MSVTKEICEWLNTKAAKENLELSTERDIFKAECDRLGSGYDAAQSELAALREELSECKRDRDTEQRAAIDANKELKAAEQRNAIMTKALERITRPHDCGCVPCTGSCTSKYALEITLEEIRKIAGAALKPTESGASES